MSLRIHRTMPPAGKPVQRCWRVRATCCGRTQALTKSLYGHAMWTHKSVVVLQGLQWKCSWIGVILADGK